VQELAVGRFEELDPNQARRLWRGQGWREVVIEVMLRAQARLLAHPVSSDTALEHILGRPPHSSPSGAAAHAEAFRCTPTTASG